VNYISEIRAFYDMAENNPVGASCISLWHALMFQANKAGWRQWFSVAISTLEFRAGLKRGAIYTARNTLKQMGAIDFKERGGNQSSMYLMKSLCLFNEHSMEHKPDTNQTQTDTQTRHKPGPLNKQDETKRNETNNPPTSPQGEGRGKKENAFIVFSGDNKELLSAFEGFEEMRNKIKQPMTERARKVLITELQKLSALPEEWVKLLDQSICKNWKSVYPLDSKRGGKPSAYDVYGRFSDDKNYEGEDFCEGM
jgi:hypothetical protein